MRKISVEYPGRQRDVVVWTPWGQQSVPEGNGETPHVRRLARRLRELYEARAAAEEAAREARHLDS